MAAIANELGWQPVREIAMFVDRIRILEPALGENRTRTISLGVSATARGLPAASLSCDIVDQLAGSDRELPYGLIRTGTQRARHTVQSLRLGTARSLVPDANLRNMSDDLALSYQQAVHTDEVSHTLRRDLIECWITVSNGGGAVGFPFPPVSGREVEPAAGPSDRGPGPPVQSVAVCDG